MTEKSTQNRRSDPIPMRLINAKLHAYLTRVRGAYSVNTERALQGDVRRFSGWCERHGWPELPISGATLAAFVESEAGARAPATIRRCVWSVATTHKALGYENPMQHDLVRLALKRMHRNNARRQKQALGLTWELCQQLLNIKSDRLIDIRNKALLAIAYDILARRSELVELQVSDLLFNVDGSAALLLRRGKSDQEGEGAMQYLHSDTVRAIRDWLQESGISTGSLFRSVSKGGALGRRLDATQIPRIYKAMAEKASLSKELIDRLSGHSPRVGAVQDMVAAGISTPAILQAGRWKTASMVTRYGERLLANRSGAAQLARLQKRR